MFVYFFKYKNKENIWVPRAILFTLLDLNTKSTRVRIPRLSGVICRLLAPDYVDVNYCILNASWRELEQYIL